MNPEAEKKVSTKSIKLTDGMDFFKELFRIRVHFIDTIGSLMGLGVRFISLPYTFLKSILLGFESRVAQSVVDSSADPTRLITDSKRNPLQEAQEKIKGAIFNVEVHRNRFIKAFQKSLDEQTKEMNEALGIDEKKRSKLLSAIYDKLGKNFLAQKLGFVIDWISYVTIRVPVSTVCALFVCIDALGKSIGKELADLTKMLLGKNLGTKFNEFIPAILTVVVIFQEITNFMSKLSINLLVSGLFYPMFAGLAAAFQSTIEKESPEISTRLKDALGDKMPDTSDDRSFSQIVSDAYAKAREYCEGTDKEKDIKGAIPTQGFISSSALSEFRLQMLSFFEKHEHVKSCVIALRAFAEMVKYAIATVAFNIGKIIAKPAQPVVGYLAKSIMKGIALVKDSKDLKVNPELAKEQEKEQEKVEEAVSKRK